MATENLQDLTGADRIAYIDPDDGIVGIDHLDLGPATVWSVLAGEAENAPDQDLALLQWENGLIAGSPSAGVITLQWPADTPELADLPATLMVDVPDGTAASTLASVTVGIAVASISAAALLAKEPRRYRRRLIVRNTFAPAVTFGLAAAAVGRMRIIYATGVTDLQVLHGERAEFEIEVWGATAVVTRAARVGKDSPALISAVLDGGGASPTTTTFQPWLRQLHDPVIVLAHRTSSGNPALPAGKGYDARTEDGFVSGVHAVGVGAIRLAISADHGADGVFDNIGSFTHAAAARVMALRGCVVSAVYVESGTGASLAYQQLASLPAGARVWGVTGHNLNTGSDAIPAGITPITYYRQVRAAWSYGMFLTGVISSFEPPAFALGSSIAWFSVVVVLVPAG